MKILKSNWSQHTYRNQVKIEHSTVEILTISGRFNISRRNNSNYKNKNTRQGHYYSNIKAGNQTVGNNNKWGCKTNLRESPNRVEKTPRESK